MRTNPDAVIAIVPGPAVRVAASASLTAMALAAFSTMSGFAIAQVAGFPAKPIRLVIPFPPGGNVDVLGRVIARQMEEQLGTPIVIDNRGGANGINGTDLVAKSQPNGYTILSTPFTFAVNHSLYRKLPYDTLKDFAPITNHIVGAGYLMVINASLPVKSVQDLIAHARTRTDPLRFSSAGVGNGQHLAAELFALRAGIRMLHVPYKGGGPALAAVVSGETHVQFPSAAPAAPFIHAGKIRALGFTGAARVASLPDVPTIAEAGLAGFEFDAGWHGWLAPAGTPKTIIDRLFTELRKAVSTPKLRDYLAGAGYDPRAESPAAFRKIIERDIERYAEILRAAKVEPQ